MMNVARSVATIVLGTLLISACGVDLNTTAETDSSEQEAIIGNESRLVFVAADGSNVPEKYRPLLDAIGIGYIRFGGSDIVGQPLCTYTHIGNGLAITAGHCQTCVEVRWGFRTDREPYLVSKCTARLASERALASYYTATEDLGRDYQIVRVDPAPPTKIDIDLNLDATAIESPITIFGHPDHKPLRWSLPCKVLSPFPAPSPSMFSHQCDTLGGSSGSAIIDDNTLRVVGIHDGGLAPYNYATYLHQTKLSRFATPEQRAYHPPAIAISSPTPGEAVFGVFEIAADAHDSDGSVTSVKFDLPDGTSVTDDQAPYTALFDTTTTIDGSQTIRATATDSSGLQRIAERTTIVSNDALAPATCAATTYTSGELPLRSYGTSASTLTVSDVGFIESAVLNLDIRGLSPDSARVTLTAPNGKSTIVNDLGPLRFGRGILIKDRSLESLAGHAAHGLWTVTMAYTGQASPLTKLAGWSLTITPRCNGR